MPLGEAGEKIRAGVARGRGSRKLGTARLLRLRHSQPAREAACVTLLHVGAALKLDSFRGSSVKMLTIQRRLARPPRKDDTHTSRSVNNCCSRHSFICHWAAEVEGEPAPHGGAPPRASPSSGYAPRLQPSWRTCFCLPCRRLCFSFISVDVVCVSFLAEMCDPFATHSWQPCCQFATSNHVLNI